MPLETFSDIDSLDDNWPLGTDPKSEGDNHLRGIKQVLKWTFENLGDVQLEEILTEYARKDGTTFTDKVYLSDGVEIEWDGQLVDKLYVDDAVAAGAAPWGSFSGTNGSTLGANGMSCVRNGTGLYTITLATAKANANYPIQLTCSGQAGQANNSVFKRTWIVEDSARVTKSVTVFGVACVDVNGTPVDPTRFYVGVPG